MFNEQYNGDNKTDYSSELKEIKKPYEVIIYLSYNTIHTATSGSGWQHVKDGDEIVPAVYEAMNGYYFPTDYTVDSVNGISVTRDSYTQITVSGTPTGDLAITLPPPTQKEKEETPTATFTATGADTGMLTDVSVGMQYSVEEDVWYNITEVPMNITDVTAEYGVEVRMPSTDTNTKLDSDIQVISVTKAATPTLEATQPETINDKGVIPTTAAHEFSTDGTTWESCDGPLTDLDAGVYYVRVKATGTALASDAQEIAIAVGKCVVTFVNEDGTVLQKSEYSCGETPVFGGATPTKDSDGNVTLVFVGWSPKIVSATEDATYTAMFGIPTSQKCRICGETLYVDPDETTETHHHLYCYNEDCSAYGVLAAEVKHSGGVATCTHKAVCEVCGVEYGNVDRRNHDWDEGVITLEPTCTESGFMILTCKYDNSHTLLKILTPTGHVEGEPVIENAVAATCTAEGGYDVVIYCSVCGEEISRVRVTQDALGHDYGEWAVTKPATCTEAGIETRVCSRCGEEETRTIPALGHDYGEWVVTKPATCTEAGVETRVCSHDSGHKETHAIAALGHDFGEWVVTVEPTETSEGVETRSCSRCGETETRSIPPLGHTHDMTYHEAVAPTKTEDGSKAYYVCESCGKWFEDADGAIEITDHDSVVIPALGETEPVVYGFKTTPETKWQKGSGNDYVLTSLADFSKFVGVKVDGEFIDASHFTAEESSTKVAFKADYLETLSDGEHTLTIVSEDGEATVKINIDPAPSEPDDTPEERKSSPVIPIIIIAIVIAAAATAAVVIIVKKKKKA